MDKTESLSHTRWECKYHIVFIPKCRRKTLYGELRKHLGEVFRQLAAQRESRVEEGHLMPDHVHMLVSIPPKYAVSQVVGSSRARARFIWRGCTESGSAISWGSTSGRGGSMCRRWAVTSRSSESTSRSRRTRTNGWNSLASGDESPPFTVALNLRSRVSDPSQPL
jgi:REP element-mobilizing transposase RayT